MDQVSARQGGPSFIHDGVNCVVCNSPVEGSIVPREASADSDEDGEKPHPYPNFAEGGNTWYHGTTSNWGEGAPAGPLALGKEPNHWNTALGAHFTSLHRTAKNVALTHDTAWPGSRIAHVKLHMKNPAFYPDERQLGIDFLHKSGAEDDGFHAYLGHDYDPAYPCKHCNYRSTGFVPVDEHKIGDVGHDYEPDPSKEKKCGECGYRKQKCGIMTLKKFDDSIRYKIGSSLPEYAEKFKNYLKAQGHDGIIYGNSYEAPIGHRSAVAFDDTPVTVKKWEDLGEDGIKPFALLQHFATFQRESVVEYHEDYDQPTDDMADNVPDDGYLAAREKHNRKIEKQREKNIGTLFDADAEYNDRKLEHNEKLSNLNHEFVSALQPHKQKLSDAEEAYKPHLKALRESIEKNWEDHPDDEKARDLAQVSISAAHQPHQDAINDARDEYKKRESEVRESFMPRSNALRAELAQHAEIHQQVHQKANDDVRDLMDKRKKDLTENHPPKLSFDDDFSGRLDLNGWVMKAYHGYRHIGELHWSDGSDPDKYKKGEIAWIGVHPKYRNVGVATEMMRRARKHAEDNPDVARPEHSDNRTDMGMGWHQRLVQKDPTLASLRVKASMDFEWSGYRDPEPEPESHKGVDDPYIKARRGLFDKYQSENDKVNDSLQKVYGDLIDESNGENGGYYRSPKYNSISKNMNRLQDKRRKLNPKFYEDTKSLPHPENVQYEFHSSDDGVDRVAAFHHGEFVGHIAWHRKDRQWRYRPYSAGEVHLVEVHPEYRRHGIGTGLFREARAAHERGDSPVRPEHSKNKTNAGTSWSDAMISKDPTLASLRATGSWVYEDPRSTYYERPRPEPDSHEGVDDPFLNARRKALSDYWVKARPIKSKDMDLSQKRRQASEWHSRAEKEILEKKGPTPIHERVPELADLDEKYQSKMQHLWSKQHETNDAHARVVKDYVEAVRSAPNPENVTHHFSYDANDDHHVVAMHHGKEIGYLKWNKEADGYHGDGEIKMIEVHPDYQRHGIATNMLQHARDLYDRGEVGQSPEHSDTLTEDGEAWVSSLPPSLSLLQHFANNEDPFLTAKAAADAELDKVSAKIAAKINEAERPYVEAKKAAGDEYDAHHADQRKILSASQEKLTPHKKVHDDKIDAANKEFADKARPVQIKADAARFVYAPHKQKFTEAMHEANLQESTGESEYSMRLYNANQKIKPHREEFDRAVRDANDKFEIGSPEHKSARDAAHKALQPHRDDWQQSVDRAWKDLDDHASKIKELKNQISAEFEPHKRAFEAKLDAYTREMQPHKDAREEAIQAAEDVYKPHWDLHNETVEKSRDALNEHNKDYFRKVNDAKRERRESGAEDVIDSAMAERSLANKRYAETMQKAPHPQGVKYVYNHWSDQQEGHHAVVAIHDGKQIGHVHWQGKQGFDEYDDDEEPKYFPGEIGYIHVDLPYRRHGIATNLVQHARDAFGRGEATTHAEHSDNKTSEGEAWHQRMVEKDPKMASLLQHFASDEDPFLTIKKQEEAKIDRSSYDEGQRDQYIETMRKAPHPKNVEYEFRHDDWCSGEPNMHSITAHHNGEEIGHLIWADESYARRPQRYSSDPYACKDCGNTFDYCDQDNDGESVCPSCHKKNTIQDNDYVGGEDGPGYHPGEIGYIHVDVPYRRHGIATKMMEKARETHSSGKATTRPEHSGMLSEEGKAWVNSLPPSLSLLQHFASDEDPFLTIKKQEDANYDARPWRQYIDTMRNAPHPKNVEYKFHHDDSRLGEPNMHSITAHHNGEEIGHLIWADEDSGYEPGEIGYIHVDLPYRRHGIATKMMEKAREAHSSGKATTRPEHSGLLGEEGKAWVNSLPSSLSSL